MMFNDQKITNLVAFSIVVNCKTFLNQNRRCCCYTDDDDAIAAALPLWQTIDGNVNNFAKYVACVCEC